MIKLNSVVVMKNLNKRIDPNFIISEEMFSCGLIDITDFLCDSLKIFMEKENRFVGIVKSYMKSMDITYDKFNENLSKEDEEIYGRLLYLLKPIIFREFSRLHNKKLSEGDCVILMIRKMLQVVSELQEFSHNKELKTLTKVISKLYDNIKNRSKKDAMYNFTNQIKYLMSIGAVGKYTLDKLDLTVPKVEKTIMVGDGILIDENQGILWTGEL